MSRTSEMIEWEQKLTLVFAYSYNTEDEPLITDVIYDYGIARLKSIKDMHPGSWAKSTMYPSVFLDPEEAWRYTSVHFPKTEEVGRWLADRKKIMEE